MGTRTVTGRARAPVDLEPSARRARATGCHVRRGVQHAASAGLCGPEAERAVAIIAQLPVKERDRMTGEETGDTMMLFKTVFVFDRLSRVRSGDVDDARVGLGLPAGISLLLVRAPGYAGGGDGLSACAVVAEPAPGGRRRRRSRARLAGTPETARDKQARVPTPCSQAGNLADAPFSQAAARAGALHEMEPGARRGRSSLHVSDSGRV